MTWFDQRFVFNFSSVVKSTQSHIWEKEWDMKGAKDLLKYYFGKSESHPYNFLAVKFKSNM